MCFLWKILGTWSAPAEFAIGENFRITILSIPEGDDKVAKYPLMFTETRLPGAE